jgi:transcriptional regulator NrdR family protein
MKTFKASEAEVKRLRIVMAQLALANKQAGEAKKSVEAAKADIEKWLKEERELEVASLTIGEMVLIDEVVLIEIGKTARFDEKAFLLREPALHAEFKRDVPRITYKPIA